MSELDNFLGDLLKDPFSNDDFGADGHDPFGSLFSDAQENFAAFDGLANDPILGNAAAADKKKDEILAPAADNKPAADETAETAAAVKLEAAAEPAQFSLNAAPSATLPVTPTQWSPQQPTTPFMFGTTPSPTNVGAMPAVLPAGQPNPFVFPPLAPALVPVALQPQHNNLQKQFRRMVDIKEKEEEDKKEKKRLAVRRCREKKRKEMKELESRAGTFDEEIRELRQQLKRARTQGQPVENSARNLEQVQALLAALRNQDSDEVAAIANRLVSGDCTATTPCASLEAQGKKAVIEHFKVLGNAFSLSNMSTSFTFDSSSQSVIRCNWSVDLKQISAAFGIHTCPNTSKIHTVKGGCRFTFSEGKLVDVVCTWNHSHLILQLLGIPFLQN